MSFRRYYFVSYEKIRYKIFFLNHNSQFLGEQNTISTKKSRMNFKNNRRGHHSEAVGVVNSSPTRGNMSNLGWKWRITNYIDTRSSQSTPLLLGYSVNLETKEKDKNFTTLSFTLTYILYLYIFLYLNNLCWFFYDTSYIS